MGQKRNRIRRSSALAAKRRRRSSNKEQQAAAVHAKKEPHDFVSHVVQQMHRVVELEEEQDDPDHHLEQELVKTTALEAISEEYDEIFLACSESIEEMRVPSKFCTPGLKTIAYARTMVATARDLASSLVAECDTLMDLLSTAEAQQLSAVSSSSSSTGGDGGENGWTPWEDEEAIRCTVDDMITFLECMNHV